MKNQIKQTLLALLTIVILSALTFARNSNEFPIAGNLVGKVKPGITVETKFTSFFTDLKKDCRERKSSQSGHVSFFCKGPENYRIHYFDSATTLEFSAETLDRRKSIRLASQSLNYLKENGKIEWRLADGKPFAVIMPVYKYKTKDGLIAYPAQILSEKIIVRGLEGFERISFEEEGKGANLRARNLADHEYSEAIIPAKRIEIPEGEKTLTLEETLVKGDEKIKYVINAKQRHQLSVIITTLSYDGEEGPVTYGIVTDPNGERDGQPGGKIFDSVTIDGDYEIMIAQNMAKSRAKNVRMKVTIRLAPLDG